MEKKVFFQNLGKKTFALTVALTFWIIANLEFDVERDIRMPLNLTNLPASLIIVNKQPESVDLSLRGPRSRLSSFAYSNKTLSVDLSRTRQGSSKIDMKRSAADIVPRGVDIIAARPLKLSLNVDRLVTRKFPVTPVPGEPDSGYEISGPIKNRSRVRGHKGTGRGTRQGRNDRDDEDKNERRGGRIHRSGLPSCALPQHGGPAGKSRGSHRNRKGDNGDQGISGRGDNPR